MIVPWVSVPSPDGVKSSSWRIRLLVRPGPLDGESHSGFFDAILDTGALWTTFTENFAPAASISDITTGRPTRIQWLGLDHLGWLHRIRLILAIDPDQTDTVTLEPLDVLFIRQFPHGPAGRLVSLGVLGMDCMARLSLTLDGPSANTRF